NKAYGKKFASADLHDTLQSIKETHFDVLTGRIEDGTIYIDLSGSDFRHSEHSTDLIKLKNELDMPVKVRFNSGRYMEKEEELDVDVAKKKLANRRFFHGTSLNFLPQILQKGLTPTDHTNYKYIEHDNKIFFTMNLEKAQYHAFNAAQINKSFPIIVELRIPDVSKLVVDYDLARDVYGDKSKIMKQLGYSKFNKGYERDGMGYKKDITNKIGIYGYVGRIPATYIKDIWIDLYTYSNYQDIFNPELGEFDAESDIWNEFEDVRNWSEISKNDIMRKIEDAQEEYQSQFEDEDYEDEYSEVEDDEKNN
ncbi:MAG: Vibrio phage, partial [Bacteroidota bacterium]